MLRSITLLTLISAMSDFIVAFNNHELRELRKVMQQFHQDYNQHNISRLKSDFKDALHKYGDGYGVSSSPLQSFLKKMEDQGEVNAMQKLENEWKDYTETLGKHYSAKENSFRMSLFEANELLTERMNHLYDEGLISYKTGLNEFADMTDSEFRFMNGYLGLNETGGMRSGRRSRQAPSWSIYSYDPSEALPSFVDWSKSGYVSPVRNQGHCASCYAFATASALESYYKRKTHRLLTLSPQNIMDCTWSLGNLGCRGGYTNKVFEYAQTYGIALESQYPYVGKERHSCYWRKDIAAVNDNGYYRINVGDELGLKSAVAKFGPVVVAVSGYQESFKFYKSGIYSGVDCKKPDHAVVVVGYGTHPRFGDYWIIKNSWGTNWGVNGYGYMVRNKGNMCFITTAAMFPK